MTFNIHQLDNLSYEEVEPILIDYINEMINQFVDSPEGEAHIKDWPQGGNWIGSLIEMGYMYGETTLPQMSKSDVQQLMESILPRKITILDPSEAEGAIPELVAFWKFLQREYKLHSAGAIVKYLETLAPKFPAMMCDLSRAGFAKAFLITGQQAGFDMTTEEGIKAFQQQYNANLKSQNPDPITLSLKNMMQGLASPSIASSPKPEVRGQTKTSSAKKNTTQKDNRKKK